MLQQAMLFDTLEIVGFGVGLLRADGSDSVYAPSDAGHRFRCRSLPASFALQPHMR